MPTRITIECSHCGAKLNLADSSKLGKKIKCPKCSEVFVASSDDLEDDLDELEDDEADDELPARRGKKGAVATSGKKGPAKAGKGKKGKKSGSNAGLIIGGVVGVVVLLGALVGVLFAVGVFSGAVKIDPNQIVVNSQPGSGTFSSLLKAEAVPAKKVAAEPTENASSSVASANSDPIPARGPVPEVAQWLPPDTEMVIHVRPAEILAAPLTKEILKSMQMDTQLQAATDKWRFKPEDIESVTIGISKLAEAQQRAQQLQMSMMRGQPAAEAGIPALVVIKLKRPAIDHQELLPLLNSMANGQPFLPEKIGGVEYVVSRDQRTKISVQAILVGDKSILLMGEWDSVNAATKSGANSKPLLNFGFVDWTDQLTLAVAPQDTAVLKQQMTAGLQGNPMGAAMAPIAEGAVGFSLALSVKGGVEAEIAVGCTDAAKTDAIVKSLTDLVDLGRGQYSQAKSQLPPWAQPLTDQLVENVKVSGENRVVVVDTNLPDSAKDQLAQLPSMLMAQAAMTAALGGNRGRGPAGANPFSPSTTESPGDEPETPSPGDSPASVTITDDNNVKAASAEGLPKPFELTGSLQDGFSFEFDATGKPKKQGNVRKLSFSVQLGFSGPEDQCIIGAIGKLKPGEAQTAGGKKIKLTLNRPSNPDGKQPDFQPILNFPDFGGVSASIGNFELTVPAKETEALKSLTGSFRFVAGKKSKLLQVQDLRSQAGKEVMDPDLKAAGLQIKLENHKDAFGEAEVAVISVKKGYLLSEIQGIDEAGKWNFDAMSESGSSAQVQILKPKFGDKKLADGIGIQAFLYSDLKEVEVPFAFEDIPLPEKKEE